MITNTKKPEAVRFILIGSARSGTGFLRTSIDSHPNVVCLGEVLHMNDENVRETAHKRYFKDDEWLKAKSGLFGRNLVVKYIEKKLWREAKPDKAFGFKLLYWQVENLKLWDYIKKNSSKFIIIHIIRNPVAIYVSLEQTKLTQKWTTLPDEKRPLVNPVNIDIPSFLNFADKLKQQQEGIRRSAGRIIEVQYNDAVANYNESMNKIIDFLTLKQHKLSPTIVKQHDWDIRKRIANFKEFENKLPDAYRHYLDWVM